MEYITCMDEVLVDNKYYYLSHAGYNSLFRVERESLQTEWIGMFPDVDICKERIHRRVFCYREHLFFFPLSGRYLHIYSLKDNTIKSIEVITQQEGIAGNVAEVICFHDSAYIFPSRSNQPLYIFNFETCELIECMIWNQKIEQLLGKQNFIMDVFAFVKDKEDLWISIFCNNIIVKMDLETWKMEKYQLNLSIKLRNITKKGDIIYATLVESTSIFCWNSVTKEERMLGSPLSIAAPRPFMRVVSVENKLFVIPEVAVPLQMIDEKEGEIFTIGDNSNHFVRIAKGAMYASTYLVDNRLWCFPRASSHLLSISLNSLELQEHRIELPFDTEFWEFIRKRDIHLLLKKQFHMENNEGKNLKFFFDMVIEKEREENRINHEELIGSRIWKEIKGYWIND